MRPIGKYVVIKKIKEEMKTDSGLLRSRDDADGFRYQKATVVKEGTEVKCVSEGDEIYYDKSAGYSMFIEDTPYTIILERDVVVVV